MTESAAQAQRWRRNVRWNLFGSMAYGAGQWIQLAIIARGGGPAAVGVYAFALALSQPIMALASLQTRTLQATDARGEYRFREYRRLRALTAIAAVAAIMLIGFFRDSRPEALPVLVAVCAMRAADLMSDIYFGEWQRHERMHAIGAAMCVNATSSVLFMSLAWLLGFGVAGEAAGGALGSGVALVAIHAWTAKDRVMRRTLAGDPEQVAWGRIARLAFQALPLGFIMLLGAIAQNVPRYFIHGSHGNAALGLFAAANQLTSAGLMVVGSLSAAAVPRFADLYTQGDLHGFRAFTRKLVLACLGVGIVGVVLSSLVGREVLARLYRPEFGSGAHTLVILSVAAGVQFMASIQGYALTAARVIAVQPVLLSATLAVLVACCAALVPSRGTEGAAWAVVAATAVQVVVSELLLARLRVHPAARARELAAP